MNQAFKHNFNVAKADIAKLNVDHNTHVDLRSDYREVGHTRNICFVWLDGKRIFLNYSYLVSAEFSPSESAITLHFTSHVFILRGINLENLFYDFMNQIAKQVSCIDTRYNDIQEEGMPIVNQIDLRPREP